MFWSNAELQLIYWEVFFLRRVPGANVGPLSDGAGCCRLRSESSADVTWACVGGTAIVSTSNDLDGSSWLRARLSCQSAAQLLSITGLRCACHFSGGRGRGRQRGGVWGHSGSNMMFFTSLCLDTKLARKKSTFVRKDKADVFWMTYLWNKRDSIWEWS